MKPRPSPLNAHSDQLAEWFGQNLTYKQVSEKLLDECGVKAVPSSLSRWWQRWQQASLTETVLHRITSGAEMTRTIEKQFGKTPAPETAQIVKLLRVIVMQMSVNSASDPALLELVGPLMRSILDFLKLEEKQKDRALDERRVVILEARAAKADEAETVTKSTLTEAEKSARYKEIFGLA